MPTQRNLWNPVAWQDRKRHARPRPQPRFQRTFDLRLPLRIVAFCLLWVALLVWPTPQISAYIGAHGLGGVGSALHRIVPFVPSGASTPTTTRAHPTASPNTPAKLQYWQVGLAADIDDAQAIGARSTIETRVPQQVSANTTNYFWVGAYLRDNSFIQAGYYIPWFDTTQANWFYCAFYADGRKGPCVNGPPGSAGANGTRHTYSISSIEATTGGDGKVTWRITMDGSLIGQFAWAVGDTGRNVPVIYAESSGFAPHPSTSVLGPVDFVDGLDVLHSGDAGYQPAAHLIVMYSAPTVCPPYGMRADGHGGILLGSGLPCPALYDTFQ
jgi:hypothetical protein